MLNNKVAQRWGVRDVVNMAMKLYLLDDMQDTFLIINNTSRVYTCIIIYSVNVAARYDIKERCAIVAQNG